MLGGGSALVTRLKVGQELSAFRPEKRADRFDDLWLQHIEPAVVLLIDEFARLGVDSQPPERPIAYTSPLTRRWMPVPKIKTVPSEFTVVLSKPRSEVSIDAYGLVNVSLRLGCPVNNRKFPSLSK